MCVQHWLYVGLLWVCPCLSDMGFMRANRTWIFALVFPCVSDIGFMWASHLWVFIGFAHACLTCGLTIYMDLHQLPTWAYVSYVYGFVLVLPMCVRYIGFTLATHFGVCIGFANVYLTWSLCGLPKMPSCALNTCTYTRWNSK